MFKTFLILGVVSCLVVCIQCESVNACPDELSPGHLRCDDTISTGFNDPIHTRCPPSGFFTSKITCVLVTDLYRGTSKPVINGGVGFAYVEVDIDSDLLTKLSYEIQVYTQLAPP
ncbi:uncharacterized protein LOC114325731 [Diabrotica virgifera virgifera]|uniref:Uncharacterized protein n=1 Tax=Diabrotica virgifera virgifera TaxID=50390 RepID=A0ABM5IC84_DIAVI|nr:uncharacterized protein LOC114325731 [Diabrotica virgifera virgifera]